MTEIWIYEGRNSAPRAFWNYKDARTQQDIDNGCTLEDIQLYPDLYGDPEWGGSEEQGWFYIDDGGAITKVEVEGPVNPIQIEKVDLPPVEFSVGDSVRTTLDWADRLNSGKQLGGRICRINEVGPGLNVKRLVQVQFENPVFWNFTRLWFDPEELELDSTDSN